jgi:hypothetical protein
MFDTEGCTLVITMYLITQCSPQNNKPHQRKPYSG